MLLYRNLIILFSSLLFLALTSFAVKGQELQTAVEVSKFVDSLISKTKKMNFDGFGNSEEGIALNSNLVFVKK